MKSKRTDVSKPKRIGAFNAQAFLESTGVARKIVEYRRGEAIFTQGEPCEHVMYIQKGNVKLSVLSKAGREAVVAMLGAGEFLAKGAWPVNRHAWGVRRRPRTAPSCS